MDINIIPKFAEYLNPFNNALLEKEYTRLGHASIVNNSIQCTDTRKKKKKKVIKKKKKQKKKAWIETLRIFH